MSRAAVHVRGFTLVELIVAMMITCIVAATIASAIKQSFDAEATVQNAVNGIDRAGIAMSSMERDFKCAMPPTGLMAAAFYGESGGGGGGESDDVYFYGPVPPATEVNVAALQQQGSANNTGMSQGMSNFALGGTPSQNNGPLDTDMRMVEYYLQQDGNDSDLVRAVTSNLLADQVPDPDVEVLCRGVTSFTVEYYDGTTWQTSWDSTQTSPVNSLPEAVRVTLILASQDGKSNPTEVQRIFSLPCYVPQTDETTGGAP